ncbi:MAG TPA: chlorite dismutase family protein [Candidatus Dormibacteraeota bacterium]|nr:chlorite dismutase family protein [Candidatus Dormibacteraeota bacterium]
MKAGVQPGGAESPISVSFAGGDAGGWRVDRIDEVRGQGLESVSRLAVVEGGADTFFRSGARWVLLGVTSHDRYSTAGERQRLLAAQAPLGRPEATRAALIPIKKSEDWWALTHDERRAIFEERSHHIATSLDYLPTIARRLHHSRDLGQPFDFLTWFEYAPTAVDGFEELVRRLRMSDEWTFVEREIDIRLTREPSAINRSG